MAAPLCEFAENHCVIHLKWVKSIVCKSYLNKVFFRKEFTEEGPGKPPPQDGRAHCMQRKESVSPRHRSCPGAEAQPGQGLAWLLETWARGWVSHSAWG